MPLRVAAAWSWRIIVVGIVLIAIARVVALLSALVLPLVIALLISAPLERLVSRMHRRKVPRGLGAALAILLLVAVVVGLGVAIGTSVASGFGSLRDSAAQGFTTLVNWLVEGPLQVSSEQINGVVDQVMNTVRDNAWGLASGAWSVTGTIGALVAGVVLALISLYFFLLRLLSRLRSLSQQLLFSVILRLSSSSELWTLCQAAKELESAAEPPVAVSG